MASIRSQTKAGYYDDTTGTGKVHVGNLDGNSLKMEVGANAAQTAWLHSNQFYNNILWNGRMSDNTTGNLPDPATGLVDLTGGGLVRYTVSRYGMELGNWVIKWPNTDTCDVTMDAGTLIYDGPNEPTPENRKIYTITESDAGYQTTNFVRVTIQGGTWTGLEIITPNSETAHDNGEVLADTHKTEMTGIRCLRFMQQSGHNDSSARDLARMPPLGHLKGSGNLDSYDAGTPDSTVGNSGIGQHPYYYCKAVEELDCDMWLTVGHRLTDAALTEYFNLVWDNLGAAWKAAGHKIYVQNGNEYWNTQFTQYRWEQYGDADPVDEAPFDGSTVTCTSTAHNMATGTQIVVYDNITHSDYPYGDFDGWYIIADTADTFRLADSAALALAGEDTLTTGSRATPDANVTTLTYKKVAESTELFDVNHANRCLHIWSIADGIFDRANTIHLGDGMIGQPARTTRQLNAPGFREELDLFCIQVYPSFQNYADWQTATFQQITDYLIEVNVAGKVDQIINDHMQPLNGIPMCVYEGGDGNQTGTSNWPDPGAGETYGKRMIDWARSSATTDYYDRLYREMSRIGITMFAEYQSHSRYASTLDNPDYSSSIGAFGWIEYSGQTPSPPKYLGVKPFLDAGGLVPKA